MLVTKIVNRVSVFLAVVFVFCGSVFAPVFASEAFEPEVVNEPAVVSESAVTYSGEGLYYDAYDMFRSFLYGDVPSLTPDQTLVLTALSTIAALFCVCIPFLLVFLFIRMFLR